MTKTEQRIDAKLKREASKLRQRLLGSALDTPSQDVNLQELWLSQLSALGGKPSTGATPGLPSGLP